MNVSRIADDVAAWLDLEIPGEIAALVAASREAQRRSCWAHYGRACIGVPGDRPDWPHMIGQQVQEVRSDQLRSIAELHEEAAAELQDDAETLRAMCEQAEHEEGVRSKQDVAARGAGGVYKWEAIDHQTAAHLRWGGLPTVEDVGAALRAGTLHKVEGIGPRRLARICKALVTEGTR